jgi:hypothetical protein
VSPDRAAGKIALRSIKVVSVDFTRVLLPLIVRDPLCAKDGSPWGHHDIVGGADAPDQLPVLVEQVEYDVDAAVDFG